MTTDDLVRLVREQSQRAEGLPAIPRYDVQAKLGEGATAVVYRAWDRDLRRTVALKILRESAGFSEIGRQRFRREAQAAAGLTHPNVITMHDAGEADGRLYLVMELVDGKPLNEVYRDSALDLRERVRLLERAARGVAAAHDKGIVHRDLKPQNILLAAGGEPKVADFGLAHMTDSTTALTRTGSTLGTPLYMSPEQVAGKSKEITPRTDVWALGAILYEVLASKPPFLGETHLEIYERITRQDPPPLRSPSADLSRDLETVALKALEKDPGKRYATAGAFADDLRRILDGEAIVARRASPLEKFWKRLMQRRALLGITALLLAAGSWIVTLQWRHAEKVRVTLVQASEDEKAGRLQEARDGYRIVRELDPSNAGAIQGFQRTNEELERHRQSLVDQARVREETVKFMKPVIESLAGQVLIVTGTAREPARQGQDLPSGTGLETIGADSFVQIKYLNVVAMDLDADSLVQQWLDDSAAGGSKAVAVKRGALRVRLPSAPPGKALIFSTPHLDVAAVPSRFRLIVTDETTRLIVEEGPLRATRRTDGASVLVERGFFLECGAKGAMSSLPLAAPGGRMIGDFDSHVSSDWVPSTQTISGSLVRSTSRPGLQGPGSLHLDYSIPNTEMVWISNGHTTPEDWSAYSGVSFWFNGSRSGREVILELWENKDPKQPGSNSERFWYSFQDLAVGWKKFEVPWREFKRHEFPNTPNDGFTRKEMWGVCLIMTGWGGASKGSCEFDQIELLPPVAQGPEKPWKPLFDGTTMDVFERQTSNTTDVWHIVNGALLVDPGNKKREAMRTMKTLDDAEVRVRFDVIQDIDRLYFSIRQDPEGRYMVAFVNETAWELKGRPHELIFVCRGEDVSATLDGRSVPIEPQNRPKSGRLQFSATSPGLRIFSIDYRR